MAGIVNNKPDLEFSFSGGNLVVRDILDEYTDLDLSNYVCLDLIIKDDEVANAIITENITSVNDIETEEFSLKSDGLHSYYRMLIPRAKKYVSAGTFPANELFYYDKHFYSAAMAYTVEDSVPITDASLFKAISLTDLYDELENGFGIEDSNTVMYNKYLVFSYELIKKAFLKTQSEYTSVNTLRSLYSVVYDKSLRYKRDALLGSIFAIREYLRMKMYDAADIIVNAIQESKCLLAEKKKHVCCPNMCSCGCDTSLNNVIFRNLITTDDLFIEGK